MPERIPEISVASPVYNEKDVIKSFYDQVSNVLSQTDMDYEIVFVDDGSVDGSLDILKACQQASSGRVRVISLARNFGHQIAITAGERNARGRAVVVMDCDLQDPPQMILEFVAKWRAGYNVVYGIRTDRKGESFFKRWTAGLFYAILRKMANVDIPSNVGDFYLLDRKVVDVLNQMDEHHRFIRGLIAWMGFRRIGVPYVREPRFAGKTKFGFWRMLKFSFDAITSFSFFPLRLIAVFGAVISFLAFLGILAAVYMKFFVPSVSLGWSSLMVVLLFIGGIQLLGIGVIGEYLARIGDDVKRRPLYTVQEMIE
ncbi:MAG TPA: glycosyltransferase family 2 protein [Candidatus Bathyarchaeia archaeon]|nr:glycosyltransferase family 2 protein [Candidatus Bathyarchaeia archaeon]